SGAPAPRTTVKTTSTSVDTRMTSPTSVSAPVRWWRTRSPTYAGTSTGASEAPNNVMKKYGTAYAMRYASSGSLVPKYQAINSSRSAVAALTTSDRTTM